MSAKNIEQALEWAKGGQFKDVLRREIVTLRTENTRLTLALAESEARAENTRLTLTQSAARVPCVPCESCGFVDGRPVKDCGFVGGDGCCEHPDNLTPECHDNACPLITTPTPPQGESV